MTDAFYVVVKGSLHASDCLVFGLNKEELAAVQKKFSEAKTDVVNGILLKGNPLQVINCLGELGYRVACSSGEAEIVWTLKREALGRVAGGRSSVARSSGNIDSVSPPPTGTVNLATDENQRKESLQVDMPEVGKMYAKAQREKEKAKRLGTNPEDFREFGWNRGSRILILDEDEAEDAPEGSKYILKTNEVSDNNPILNPLLNKDDKQVYYCSEEPLGETMACDRPPPVPSVHQTLDEMDFERGLWYPAVTGDLPRLRTLLAKGKDPNVEDKSGYTPLHYAARCGFATICTLLLENGADVNKATRAGGATALHRAALAGNDDTIIVLIKYGANLLSQDADGRIPLHRAVEASHPTAVALLLEACPLSCTIKDKSGKTARNYIAPTDKILEDIFNIIDKPQIQSKKRTVSMKDDVPNRQDKNSIKTSEKKLKEPIPPQDKIIEGILNIIDKPLLQSNTKKSFARDQSGQIKDRRQISPEKNKIKEINLQDQILEGMLKETDSPGIQSNIKRSERSDQNSQFTDRKPTTDKKIKETLPQENVMEQILKEEDKHEIQSDFRNSMTMKNALTSEDIKVRRQTPEKKITPTSPHDKIKKGLTNVIDKSGIQTNISYIEGFEKAFPETKMKESSPQGKIMEGIMNAFDKTGIPTNFKRSVVRDQSDQDEQPIQTTPETEIKKTSPKDKIMEGIMNAIDKTGIPANFKKSVTRDQSGQDEQPNNSTSETEIKGTFSPQSPQEKIMGESVQKVITESVIDKKGINAKFKRAVTKEQNGQVKNQKQKTTPEKKIKQIKSEKKVKNVKAEKRNQATNTDTNVKRK